MYNHLLSNNTGTNRSAFSWCRCDQPDRLNYHYTHYLQAAAHRAYELIENEGLLNLYISDNNCSSIVEADAVFCSVASWLPVGSPTRTTGRL